MQYCFLEIINLHVHVPIQSCSSLTLVQTLYPISKSSALFKVGHHFTQFKNYYLITLKALDPDF